ncbi:amidase family protein [Paramyrothecium foliicola]|nr:amidase family protein [Paramyrothecium foliicola]
MSPRSTSRSLGAALAALLPLVTAYNGAFIVEFARSNLEPTAVLSEISPASCHATVRHQFTSGLFVGLSFDLDCASNAISERQIVGDLKRHTDIENAWPVSTIANPVDGDTQAGAFEREPLSTHDSKDGSRLDRRSSLDPSVLIPRQVGNGTLQTLFTRSGIDRLHESNITGAGIFVALVDTGASLNHPALEGIKVRHKVNLVDNDDNIDPTCGAAMHGTQMLGIMGGKRVDELGFTGIAPDATYDIYRIAPCVGLLGTDVLIQASLMAADAGVDVLATSFGSSMKFTDDPWAVVMSRIMANGTFVAISSGNSGPGPFSGETPASGDLVASIGATHNYETPSYTFKAVSSAGDLRFTLGVNYAGFQATGSSKQLKVWFPADGETKNSPSAGGCWPLPADRKPLPENPANTILLVDWNTCWTDDADDTQLLSRLGVHSIMYYPPASWEESSGLSKIGTAEQNVTNIITLDRASANLLLESIRRGNTVTVSVPVDLNSETADGRLSQVPNEFGGLATAFSGWGPNLNGEMMPTVLAPGRMVLAPSLKSAGSWDVILGTSFSCPFAAAVAALVKQAHPNYTALEIKNAMVSTAEPLRYLHDASPGSSDRVVEDYFAPVFQQGGGIVNAYSAVNSQFTVDVGSLNFNDTANRASNLNFTIINQGSTQRAVEVLHVPAASGYILSTSNATTKSGGQDAVAEFADISISPKSITIAPGASATITVSVRGEPKLAEASTRGSYFGGFVELVSADDKIRVPYTGFGTALRDLPMIDLSNTQAASIDTVTGSSNVLTDANHVFSCSWDVNRDTPVKCSDGNLVPGLVMTWVTQSRFCNISIVDPTGNATGIEPLYTTSDSYDFWDFRGTYMYSGVDQNKAFLPAGTWVWKVEVLRLFEDATKLEDLEVWHSDPWILEWTNVVN